MTDTTTAPVEVLTAAGRGLAEARRNFKNAAQDWDERYDTILTAVSEAVAEGVSIKGVADALAEAEAGVGESKSTANRLVMVAAIHDLPGSLPSGWKWDSLDNSGSEKSTVTWLINSAMKTDGVSLLGKGNNPLTQTKIKAIITEGEDQAAVVRALYKALKDRDKAIAAASEEEPESSPAGSEEDEPVEEPVEQEPVVVGPTDLLAAILPSAQAALDRFDAEAVSVDEADAVIEAVLPIMQALEALSEKALEVKAAAIA